MGYEVKLVLLHKHETQFTEGKDYGSVIAIIDLSKAGNIVNTGIVEAEVSSGVPIEFYFPGDGDKTVQTDCYGKNMIAFPAQKMLDVLNADPDKKYRRTRMARPLLKEFIKGFGDMAYVACYGY